jgi:hypothetical protein
MRPPCISTRVRGRRGGLAKRLVLFQQALNSMPDDLEVDFSDLGEILEPGMEFVNLVHDPDPDPDFVRATCLKLARYIAPPDLPPDQLELYLAMHGDCALEVFASLQATAAAMAAAGNEPLPDPSWITQPWIDRLGGLAAPITVVISERGCSFAEVIARRASDVQIVITEGSPGIAIMAQRIRTAEILLDMVDRLR